MRYDSLGFPIPAEFDGPVADGPPGSAIRRATGPGPGKRLIVGGLLLAVVVSGAAAPAIMPLIRNAVVQWSVHRAIDCEARGRSDAAVGEVHRAIAWCGGDAGVATRLLCWSAALRLDARDATGAADDADRAVALEPKAARPLAVRALVNVVRGRPDEALADANAAVRLAGGREPDLLNHRAYVRALVGRDLAEALADIDAALAAGAPPSPAFLDTRGYVLHLLGRHREAIEELNQAIGGVEAQGRQLVMRAGVADGVELKAALRLLDRDLAVMHHHRGLACRAAGLVSQAEQDLAIARRKGYDPSRGVM